MFELGLALRYLIPRKKSLSASLVALLSTSVIALVVWLVLVFFSVTRAMESTWLEKITSLNGSIRIAPKEAYYNSYYYKSDAFALSSNYAHKTLGQKLLSVKSDPIDPSIDEDFQGAYLEKTLNNDSSIRDLVKDLSSTLKKQADLASFSEMHVTGGSLRLRLIRDALSGAFAGEKTQSFLASVPYFFALDPQNPKVGSVLEPVTPEDITGLIGMLSQENATALEESPLSESRASQDKIEKRLSSLFSQVDISQIALKKRIAVPLNSLPKSAQIEAYAHVTPQGKLLAIYLEKPHHIETHVSTLTLDADKVLLSLEKKYKRSIRNAFSKNNSGQNQWDNLKITFNRNKSALPLFLPSKTPLKIDTLSYSKKAIQTAYALAITGSSKTAAVIPFSLDTDDFDVLQMKLKPAAPSSLPYWAYARKDHTCYLPHHLDLGEAIILPKSFKEKGARIGDVGYLGYSDMQITGTKEQRLRAYVAGFYDPGLSPLAGRLIITSPEAVATIASAQTQYEFDRTLGNAFIGWTPSPKEALKTQKEIQKSLENAGLDPFFSVETYLDYEFTRPFLMQFQSDRMLFILISALILSVACCNVISFLILLVQNKRSEIAILSSMGASKKSICLIFCLCGGLIGLIAATVGSIAASITVSNLESLISTLSFLQAHPAFSSEGFGIAKGVSLGPAALCMTFIFSTLLSMLAGALAALKALRLSPSQILRSP